MKRPAIIRLGVAAACAALFAACQSVGGAPPPRAVAAVTDAGFKPEAFAEFNSNLDADDIVTTALYVCISDSCGGVGLVLFGRQTDASGRTRKELDEVLAKPRQQGLNAANRILKQAGMADLKVIGFSGFRTSAGGVGYVLDLSGKLDKDRVFGRLTMIYDGAEGRAVAAFAEKRDIVRRFGGREMLE
jgi:hypothetical protein